MSGSAFVDLCLELLSPLGPARARCMFGGHGLYIGELFVGLITDDRLYLKTDAQTAQAFAQAGCTPFEYAAKGRSVTLGFWTVPDAALESAAEMAPWARQAMQAALAARAVPGRRTAKAPAAKKRAARRSAPG